MAQPNCTEEHNLKNMGAYSKNSEFSITTDQLPGLSYRSKTEESSSSSSAYYPRLNISQTVQGRQFHDYCLLGSLSTESQFVIYNRTSDHVQAQDEGTRSTTVTPPYGLQLHAYGLQGLLSTNSSFKIENQITFNGEEQPPQGNRDGRRAPPTRSRRSSTGIDSVWFRSNINGLEFHSYAMVGANSSRATIKIDNQICFMDSTAADHQSPGNAVFSFNKLVNGIKEVFSRVYNGGIIYFSHGSQSNPRTTTLNLNISRLQPSSGSDNTNTSRDNRIRVKANAAKKSVVCDHEVNGTILHSYDLMGLCCKNNSEFTINNPISGLKREGMVPSSGSDSGPENINDFLEPIINNRR